MESIKWEHNCKTCLYNTEPMAKACEECRRDLVEVVRCKDCKNLRLIEGARNRWFGCSAIDGVDGNEFEVEGDFYCAWGERRENAVDC